MADLVNNDPEQLLLPNHTYIPGLAPWRASVAYAVGDRVLDSGVVYRATVAHTSGATRAANAANWANHTAGGATQAGVTTLAVLRTSVQRRKDPNGNNALTTGDFGQPSAANAYHATVNDTVAADAYLQARRRAHASGELTHLYADGAGTNAARVPRVTAVSRDRPAPQLIASTWHGAWTANTVYPLGAIVIEGGAVYRATVAHTSGATRAAHAANWAAFATTAWATGQLYQPGRVVFEGNQLWRCIARHTSGATRATHAFNWVADPINNLPAYQA